MRAKCFECEAVIEGEDFNAVADAFVSHGSESHAWTYPEESVRNYVRNYVEATERLTGPTERLPYLGELTVHRVTEAQVDDWLSFFDHDAFAGNPDWASCYCLEPHMPASPESPEGSWRERRAAMVERLESGGTYGYLAYVDGRPAGWVNASLRSAYGLYGSVDPDGPPPRSVIGVSCFVVAPPFRRHGVASALLDRVVEDASARGAAWIEGYPRNEPEESDAGHFHGPRSMYEARGFVPIEVRQRDTVLRRPVR